MPEKSLIKGLRMLDELGRSNNPRGVSELAAELGIAKSNAHRILTALVETGFARKRTDSGRYELTSKLWEYRKSTLSQLESDDVVSSELHTLAKKTGETVFVSILDGAETVFIRQIESTEVLRTSAPGRQPAFASSTGKAILAFQEPATLDLVAKTLRRLTDRTISSRKQLGAELQQIRNRGYATNFGEAREGVHGVAAPIRGPSGEVISAVGISGPAFRLPRPKIVRYAALVVAAAERISASLGYRPSRTGPADSARSRV
jgi:IclR family KDG regulon transcriptional repressor